MLPSPFWPRIKQHSSGADLGIFIGGFFFRQTSTNSWGWYQMNNPNHKVGGGQN